MAQKVIIAKQCDLCDHLGLPGTPAALTHILTLDKEPTKQYDLCLRCQKAIDWVLDFFRAHGQETKPEKVSVPPHPQEQAPPKKVKEREKPKELEVTPAADPPAKTKQFIVCTEKHPSNGGKPIEIEYGNRGTHTKMCHTGMQQWDIIWGDPHGILKSPCTSHAECIKTGLAFTGGTGTATHVRNCSLPRIDTNDGPSSHGEAHD